MPAFGRLPAEDPRDRRHLMASIVSAPTRTARHWWAGPVLDQGAHPHCVGYAWRQWLSTAPLRTRTGPDGPTIYRAAQERDEWPGNDYRGTSVRGGAKFLAELGHLGEYVWAFDAPTVSDWVLERGPVVVGTNWRHSMMVPDAEGFIRPTGSVVGGHAYLIVGVNAQRGVARVLNSWGPRWGQGGRAWIDLGHLDRLIREDGEACAAIEVRVP